MAEPKTFRQIFEQIPLSGNTGLARICNNRTNAKDKNSGLLAYNRNPGYSDIAAAFLSADNKTRKSFRDRF